jgi:N-acylneuraminate cytidylyltransferase
MNFIEEGAKDKAAVLRRICEEYGIMLDEVLYVGDDINDVEVMRIVGIAACPADASSEVKDVADYVAKRCGGNGAVREIIEENC